MCFLPIAKAETEELPGDGFFTEGQVWTFLKSSTEVPTGVIAREGELPPGYAEVEVRVDGTTEVTFKTQDPIMGEGVETQTCYRLVMTENNVEVGTYAAYEYLNKIYVYSPKTETMVEMLDFNVKKNESVTLSGQSLQVNVIDYIFAADRLRKRITLEQDMEFGPSLTIQMIYGLGARCISVTPDEWSDYNTYEFISASIPGEGEASLSVFYAQTAVPSNQFYSIGKEWLYSTWNMFEPEEPTRQYIMRVKENIVYADMPCRKVVHCDSDGNENSFGMEIACDIDGQVYVLDELCDRFLLKLNFNLTDGMVALADDEWSTVESVDKINVKGVSRKRITFAGVDSDNSNWKYWVEGIGANSNNYMYAMDDRPGTELRLDECRENGTVVFVYEDFKGSMGGTGSLEIGESNKNDSFVYGLDGKRIRQPQRGEPYIQGGHIQINR